MYSGLGLRWVGWFGMEWGPYVSHGESGDLLVLIFKTAGNRDIQSTIKEHQYSSEEKQSTYSRSQGPVQTR